MKPVVYVHAPSRRHLGARLTAFALQARSASASQFEVRYLALDECPELLAYEGRSFRWMNTGRDIRWSRRAGQAFILLRRRVPELMGFEGRALLMDPDILAVGDVWELLSRDLQGCALACRPRIDGRAGWSSAVMLMDCARLRHWRWAAELQELFEGRRELGSWQGLTDEPAHRVQPLEPWWNELDTLTPQTRLLHFTNRRQHPWMTGLPFGDDFDTEVASRGWLGRLLWRGPRYQPSPHEAVFVSVLQHAVQAGALTRAELNAMARAGEVRSDILPLLDQPVKAH